VALAVAAEQWDVVAALATPGVLCGAATSNVYGMAACAVYAAQAAGAVVFVAGIYQLV
jgi:adenine/guanine phosphoribosyltransferase-like PRPP-binding protein